MTIAQEDKEGMRRLFIFTYMALLVAVAAWLRMHGMGDYHLNPDESLHLNIAKSRDLSEVWRFSHYEAHPPLLYILGHYWRMLSQDEYFLRSLSLVFGLLTVVLYFFIGKAAANTSTGLCCALLITFSQGCIIQSYIIRHYMLLVFFISLSFYTYLLWRKNSGGWMLTLYSFFALLACFTHFSAVFYVACAAACEVLARLKRKDYAVLSLWISVNFVVCALAASIYYLWQPILVPLKFYFAGHTAGTFTNLLKHALIYPLATPGYVLPGYAAAVILIMGEVAIMLLKPDFIRNFNGLRFFLFMAAFAYSLGMVLVITRIYPEPGTRHSMWVLPFVILPAGWMTADLLNYVTRHMPSAWFPAPSAMLILMIAGLLFYQPSERFSDSSEYVWKISEWNEFEAYMTTLGPRDLIVTEKDDGMMLTNLYPYMGEDAFSGKVFSALAPYKQTHILFNPYYPRNYHTGIFLASLENAHARHLLDNIDRLVFLRMTWSRSPVTELMLCGGLTKEIVLFPSSVSVTRKSIEKSRASIMIVSKQTLLDDVLPQLGKAHACLNGKHDMIPGYWP